MKLDTSKLTEEDWFDIDMQLYNEFNNSYCLINEWMGELYTKSNLHDLKKAEKRRRNELIKEKIKQYE